MPSYFARVGQIMSTVTWKDYANWNDYRLEFKMRLGDPFLNFFWGAHCILKVGFHIPIFFIFQCCILQRCCICVLLPTFIFLITRILGRYAVHFYSRHAGSHCSLGSHRSLGSHCLPRTPCSPY